MKKEIIIDGVAYIVKSENVTNEEGLTYCIIRTYSAGVWAGYVNLLKIDKNIEVKDARRLWRWRSDFTLSALAVNGPKEGKEEENKYSMPVDIVYLLDVIEIIPCTEVSANFIKNNKTYYES